MVAITSSLETISAGSGETNTPTASRGFPTALDCTSVYFSLVSAVLLRDYRQLHGLDVTLAFIFQASAVSAFTLLQAFSSSSSLSYPLVLLQGNSLLPTTEAAFEEAVRCLIACGMQVAIARGVTRMVYQTALKMGVKLPQSVRHLLQIVIDTAWDRAEVLELKSAFPNRALIRNAQHDSSIHMDQLLREWEQLDIRSG